MEATRASETHASWRDSFTPEEIDSLLELRDWRSWLTIGLDWAGCRSNTGAKDQVERLKGVLDRQEAVTRLDALSNAAYGPS